MEDDPGVLPGARPQGMWRQSAPRLASAHTSLVGDLVVVFPSTGRPPDFYVAHAGDYAGRQGLPKSLGRVRLRFVLKELDRQLAAFYQGIFAMSVRLRLRIGAWLSLLMLLTLLKPGPSFLDGALYVLSPWTWVFGSIVLGAMVGSVLFVRR
jgi:hypothetical protein